MNNNIRLCVATICNDEYKEYGKVMLKSFIINNKWFNDDFLILYDSVHTVLSDTSKNEFKHIYSKCIFADVNCHINDNIFKNNVNTNKNYKHCVAKLTLFDDSVYDKILYLDSDIIVNKDISNLFNVDYPICIGCDQSFWKRYKTFEKGYKEYLNAGVIYFGDRTFRKRRIKLWMLRELLYHKGYNFFEQDVINNYFKLNEHIDGFYRLPWTYNAQISYLDRATNVDDAILHYVVKPENLKDYENLIVFKKIYDKYKNMVE